MTRDPNDTYVDLNKKTEPLEKTQLDWALRNQDYVDPAAPIIPLTMETHPDRIIVAADGRVFHDIECSLRRADMEKIRQGYGCLECLNTFYPGPPWPERCPVCGYEVRAKQSHDFSQRFLGTTWVGSRVNPDEEIERLNEFEREDKLRTGERIPGILVPDWCKL